MQIQLIEKCYALLIEWLRDFDINKGKKKKNMLLKASNYSHQLGLNLH